jgi:hypothetical protein
MVAGLMELAPNNSRHTANCVLGATDVVLPWTERYANRCPLLGGGAGAS